MTYAQYTIRITAISNINKTAAKCSFGCIEKSTRLLPEIYPIQTVRHRLYAMGSPLSRRNRPQLFAIARQARLCRICKRHQFLYGSTATQCAISLNPPWCNTISIDSNGAITAQEIPRMSSQGKLRATFKKWLCIPNFKWTVSHINKTLGHYRWHESRHLKLVENTCIKNL